MISHVDNINRNLARALKGVPIEDVKAKTGMSHDCIVNACRSSWSTRLGTLEVIASALDTTVAVLMVKEGVKTNWYDEASTVYFANNIRQIRKEKGLTQSGIGKVISADGWRTKASNINRYEKGRFPTLGAAQEIADALGVEVADLFLPPEGVV